MYCSKCGKHIGDHDKFCSGCGSRIPETSEETGLSFRIGGGLGEEEEAPAKPYTLDTSEFVWDVHEFHTKVQRPEDVRVDWERGTVTEIGKEREENLLPNSGLESKPNPGLNPNPEPGSAGMAEEFRPVTLDDIERDLSESGENEGQPISKEMRRDTARLEKFYTFNQKNEEFQKLLDREYERIRRGRGEDSPEEAHPAEHLSAQDSITPAEHPAAQDSMVPQDRSVAEEAPETDIFDNTEIIKRFDTMELEKDVLAAEPEAQNPAENPETPEEPEKMPERSTGFSSLVLDELFGKKIEDRLGEDAEKSAGEDAQKDAEQIEDTEAAGDTEAAAEIGEIGGTTEVAEVGEESSGAEALGAAAPAEPETASAPVERDIEPETEGASPETAGDERKGKILSVILTIIILLLLAELAILGIRYLAPDSKAAAFIRDKTEAFSEMLFSKEQKDSENEGDKENSEKEDSQIPDSSQDTLNIVADRTPASDKTGILMDAAIACNQNITEIKADPDLKYDSSVRYSSKKIYDTVPLEDNVLSEGSGEVSYVDREAVKTLIAFDSGWIDYVNNGNDAIFHSVLKEGSTAYKNCAAFQKKVKKSFESLAVGEIRKDEKGYYIWAHEVIQTTNAGKTTTDEYNWVYYMEPQEGKLLIVDYYKF